MLAELAARGEPVAAARAVARRGASSWSRTAAGAAAADRWAAEVHRRTGGHPFFARQLTELLADPASPGAVPPAVRDLVAAPVERLSAGVPGARRGRRGGRHRAAARRARRRVRARRGRPWPLLVEEGVHGGRPGPRCATARGRRLAHDLFRETICAAAARPASGSRCTSGIADALERRHARGVAGRAGGPGPALRGRRPARRAARGRCAGPARPPAPSAPGSRSPRPPRTWPGPAGRVEDAGDAEAGGVLVDLLVEEADARARAGDPAAARALLDDARDRAAALDDAERLGRVALGVQRLGARFAMPRDAVVDVLDAARPRWTAPAPRWRPSSPPAWPASCTTPCPRTGPAARPLSEQALDARPRAGRPGRRWPPACSPATTCCGPRAGPPNGSPRPGDRRARRAHRRRRAARRGAAAHRQRTARGRDPPAFRRRARPSSSRRRAVRPAPPRLPGPHPPRRARR